MFADQREAFAEMAKDAKDIIGLGLDLSSGVRIAFAEKIAGIAGISLGPTIKLDRDVFGNFVNSRGEQYSMGIRR